MFPPVKFVEVLIKTTTLKVPIFSEMLVLPIEMLHVLAIKITLLVLLLTVLLLRFRAELTSIIKVR
jgi:hypothetical protein